jgi:hypothetical protein
MNYYRAALLVLSLCSALIAAPAARAETVFNTPHFVAPGDWAVGLEPVLVLSDGAGVGINARYTQGITDLLDASAIVGTGSGPRRFRIGGNVVFDVVPDLPGQPGIGIAGQAVYYRLPDSGQLETTAIPYIHKAFPVATEGGGTAEVDPFIAVPVGIAFTDGTYHAISNVSIGASFKNVEHLRYIFEFGVNINHSESYFSGGIVYYH